MLDIGSASDMEMDAFNEDYKVAGKSKLKSYEVEHESLAQASVESLMATDIAYVASLCGMEVSPSSPSSFFRTHCVALPSCVTLTCIEGELVPTFKVL